MSDYEFDLKAQQWSTDNYYVASSSRIYPMTVISTTKQEAIDKAEGVLGTPSSGHYWRFWTLNIREIRTTAPEPCKPGDGADA